MSDSLDVIIVDDESWICDVLTEIVKQFYAWGEVLSFTDADEAIAYCRNQRTGVAIFILDVFMGNETGFEFLDAIVDRYPMAYDDSIIITGNASDDIVNMCIASDITCLIEKPIRPYALQFAIRAIVSKYVKFARKLMDDPMFAETVSIFNYDTE